MLQTKTAHTPNNFTDPLLGCLRGPLNRSFVSTLRLIVLAIRNVLVPVALGTPQPQVRHAVHESRDQLTMACLHSLGVLRDSPPRHEDGRLVLLPTKLERGRHQALMMVSNLSLMCFSLPHTYFGMVPPTHIFKNGGLKLAPK